MALIYCTDCGKEISDKATTCPNCGCPVTKALEFGTIYFNWKGRRGDSIRKTTVFVDDREIGVMRPGDYLDTTVRVGTHKIDLYQGKRHLLEERVQISDRNPEEYYAYKEAMGLTHARLKRVDADIDKWKQLNSSCPRCPTCGSTRIKRISVFEKRSSIKHMGLASGSIGKTFECEICGYTW